MDAEKKGKSNSHFIPVPEKKKRFRPILGRDFLAKHTLI